MISHCNINHLPSKARRTASTTSSLHLHSSLCNISFGTLKCCLFPLSRRILPENADAYSNDAAVVTTAAARVSFIAPLDMVGVATKQEDGREREISVLEERNLYILDIRIQE